MTSSNITALLPCPDRKGYVDIYADGELMLTVSEATVLEAGLHTGMRLDHKELVRIEHSVVLARAKNKAYDYLSYGDMSEKKLFDKLTHFGFDADTARECVDSMKDRGYIDNLRYAASLADSLARIKLYGPRRIKQELMLRGISAQDADNAIDALDIDYVQSVITLVNGKLRRDMSQPSQIKKLITALMRQGHDYDTIKQALRDVCESENDYE